jgi:hypothetical protein
MRLTTLFLVAFVSVFSVQSVLAQDNVSITTNEDGVYVLPDFKTVEEVEEFYGVEIPSGIVDVNDPAFADFLLSIIPDNFASSEENRAEQELVDFQNAESAQTCTDYYKRGSVATSVNSSITSTVTGAPLSFNVGITNNNDYPVAGGTLYAKVFREQSDESIVRAQGDDTIDQFFVLRDVALDAGATRTESFTWNVPLHIPTGDYYIATFFASQERYNLSGVSYTDHIVGGVNRFYVDSEVEGVYFDKTNVSTNGNSYRFVGSIPQIAEETPAQIKATILNNTNSDASVEVTWTLYKWDALHDGNKIEEKIQTITIPAEGSAMSTYEAEQDDYSVYMATAELQYKDAKSFINVRYVREGVDIPRINFPGVTAYPLEAGKQQTLFACLHNTGTAPIVENGELTLRLADEKGREIHTYTYEGPITGAMMGVKDDFTPQKTSATFSLLAILKVNGETVEEVETLYNCDDINRTLCSTGTNPFETVGTTGMSVIILVLVLLLGGGFVYVRKKNSENDELADFDFPDDDNRV